MRHRALGPGLSAGLRVGETAETDAERELVPREPEAVRDWLQQHGPAPQMDVLSGMEAAGWSRSTTQHRLQRLVLGGVVQVRPQGRLKVYSTTDRAPQRVVGLAAVQVAGAQVAST